MTIDVARARAETPGCAEVLHFNNAGASLMPAPVLEAVKGYLDLEARIGGYEAAQQETDRWERAYDAAAALLGADPDEIALIENATRAWDMAFYSVPLRAGDRILTSQAEYVSNYLALLQVARRSGAVVEVVPSDAAGQLDVSALRGMMDERVRLVAVTHVPTSGGLVNPVEAVGEVVRETGALYLVDACQSVGQLPVDVRRIGCDVLSGTGRKFLRAPRGTGFLYVRRGVLERLEPPFVDLHSARWTSRDEYEWRPDARRFENWETNYSTRVGLAVAIDYALRVGMDDIWERNRRLGALLRERLASVPGVTVRDQGAVQGAIVTFTVEATDPVELRAALLARRMNVSVSFVEFARLDLEPRGLSRMVRASVHYYNTEREVERFVEAVSELAR